MLDETRRLAFVTGEGNATLAVIDLRTMHVMQRLTVGDDPIRTYSRWSSAGDGCKSHPSPVSSRRSGATGDTLVRLGDERIPHAHTVAVEPRTHRVFVPLDDVGGRPVLRVLEPAARSR